MSLTIYFIYKRIEDDSFNQLWYISLLLLRDTECEFKLITNKLSQAGISSFQLVVGFYFLAFWLKTTAADFYPAVAKEITGIYSEALERAVWEV